MTNTQTIVDAPHKDLRRARAAGAVADPDHDRLGDGDRPDLPRARRAGSTASRCACRCSTPRSPTACSRSRAPTTVEEVNGLLEGRGRRAARRHPRLRGAAARLRRLQGRPALGDRRRALDDGRRRHAGEDARLVRQRVGLRQPAGRARRARSAARAAQADAADGSDRRERASARVAGRPAQLRARHRRLLGGHAHRRRDPRCSSSSTSTSSATRRSQVASLFLFYEFFGIVTNLVGGWLAARLGLKATLVVRPGDPGRRAGDARARARRAGSSCRT